MDRRMLLPRAFQPVVLVITLAGTALIDPSAVAKKSSQYFQENGIIVAIEPREIPGQILRQIDSTANSASDISLSALCNESLS